MGRKMQTQTERGEGKRRGRGGNRDPARVFYELPYLGKKKGKVNQGRHKKKKTLPREGKRQSAEGGDVLKRKSSSRRQSSHRQRKMGVAKALFGGRDKTTSIG